MVFKHVQRYVLLTLIAVVTVGYSYAQTTISGQITDADDGSGLPGVNILEKGTTNGTISDFDGNYTLTVSDGATVVFSFIGYAAQEVVVGSQSSINVSLAPEATALSEVVVVGYGTQTKQEITSSVTSIKEEDFNQGNVNDPAQLLQGKVPGLNVVKDNGGDPNAGFTVRLRGLSSVGPNNGPLVIIDGVPSQNLNQVDPNDIASIDVLKDGAAAAIYGTRGSAGVIIVTTKKGRVGEVTASYNGSMAIDAVAKTVPVLSPSEYRERQPDANLDKGSSTDWFDEITDTPVSQIHNLSLGGGTQQTRYRVSLNYRDQNGVLKGTGFNRLNSRITLRQKALKDKLTIDANIGVTTQKSNFGFNEAFRYATVYNPTEPVRLQSGDANFERWDGYNQVVQFDYYNPVAIIEQNINEGNAKDINFNIKGSYNIVDGLDFSAQYGQQYRSSLQGRYFDKNSFWVGADRNGLAERQTDDQFWETFESTLTFDKDVSSGMNLKLLGGYSWQENTNEGFGASGGNFVTDEFTYNNLGGALDFANGLGNIYSYKNKQTLIAFFGRVNLSINDTYFFMASYRYEGNSAFGENNKWGGFPAVSAGVDIDRLVDLGSFDQLKFRASYGVTGTLPPESYLSLRRLGPVGNAFIDGSFKPAFGPVSNPNPDLSWEQKAEVDIGLDFSLLDYRLTGTLDWYQRRTTDLILNAAVPVPPNTFDRTWTNVGEFTNSGLEGSLNYLAVNGSNFTYTPGVNFATFSTKLVDYNLAGGTQRITNLGAPGQNGTFMILVKEGDPIGQIYGPEHDKDNPVNQSDGSWNIIDQNGDGVINDDDDVVIGNGLPDFTYGWSNLITFGNWDANVFFRGAVGHDLVNTYRAFYENPNLIGSYNVMQSSFDGELDNLNGNVNIFGSYHVESASYFMLDNMQIGYNLPIADGSAFQKARFFVTGQNLFIISGYSGVSPEIRFSDGDGGVLAPGIDRRNTWFRTRTFQAGVQLGF